MYNCIAYKISLFKTVQVHLELLVSPCEGLQECTVGREHATIINSKRHFRVTSRRDQGSLLTSFPGLPHPQCLSSTVSRSGEGLGTRLLQGLITPHVPWLAEWRLYGGMTKLCFHMILPLVLGRWVGLWLSPSQSPQGCHTWLCRPPTSLCTPAPCPDRKTCHHHSSCHSSRNPHSDCHLLKHKTFHHLHPIPSLVLYHSFYHIAKPG